MKINSIEQGQWHYPQWERGVDEGHWLFVQDRIHIVGEACTMGSDVIKWHCKTSDWRDTNATTMEQAKAECEASFWKDQWENLRNIILSKAKGEMR